MKKMLFILIVLIHSGLICSQQIGNGFPVYLNSFETPLGTGAYISDNTQAGFPDEEAGYPWKYLFSVRSGSVNSNQQLQISSRFMQNDRLFFRKVDYPMGDSHPTSQWYELATRGINHFTGKQTVDGDFQVGYNNYTYTSGYGKRLFFGDEWENNKPLWIARYNAGANMSEMRVNIGSYMESYNRFVVGTTRYDNNEWLESLSVLADGNVGIGVSTPRFKLEVNGTIHAKEVRIDNNNWPDYVFSKDYRLPSLPEVERHIETHQHLPGIPSAGEVEKNGIGLGEMNAKLLQKIEEITLYMIQQQKEIESLKNKVETLENR